MEGFEMSCADASPATPVYFYVQLLWQVVTRSGTPEDSYHPGTASASYMGFSVDFAFETWVVPSRTPSGSAKGTVLVNGKAFRSGAIPYGSRIDATKGRLSLTTRVGRLQLYGAGATTTFRLVKSSEKGKPLDELRLVGGDFSVCSRSLASLTKKKKPKTVRKLWARGKGKFRTRAKYAYTTVRGTWWLTADRCDGSFVQVRQGLVDVFDIPRRKNVLVRAGKSYLAAKP
jgi:hypothetical protein